MTERAKTTRMVELDLMDILGHVVVGFDDRGRLILDNGVKLAGTRIVMRDRVTEK